MKKILSLAIGILFSSAAQAGYTKYDFHGPISGFFIQHDSDKSIAMYEINAYDGKYFGHFAPSGIFSNIEASSTYRDFEMPTNFSIFSTLTNTYYQTMRLTFSLTEEVDIFRFTGKYAQDILPDFPDWGDAKNGKATFKGVVRKSYLTEEMLAHLDAEKGYMGGLDKISPTLLEGKPPGFIPEPTSIALMLAGALGVGMTRRKTLAPH